MSDGTQLFLAPSATKAQNMSAQARYFDEGPCDGQLGPLQEPSTVSFCQPSEHKGSYGVRYWTMRAGDMCEKLEKGDCFTLDDMHCDGSPDLCLKWYWEAYAGRVVLPAGVRLSGWGSWSCGGTNRFSTSGPSQQPYDFWDWWWRVDAFKISLMDGYTCSPGASPPVQPSRPPCKPAEITGRWAYWFSQQSGTTTERSISIGLETTETVEDEQSYGMSFTHEVEEGVQVGGVEVTGGAGASLSVRLSAQQSATIRHLVSSALQRSRVETETKTLTGAGTYWQFIMYATNSDGCSSHTYRAFLPEYIRTPNMQQAPCCAPGLFEDINVPSGACVDGAPRLC